MWQSLKEEVRRQHLLLDRQIVERIDACTAGGVRVFCARGCRSCCSLAVDCTFTEALLVAAAMTREHAAALDAHAARLLAHIGEATDLKSFLRLHRQKVGFCPFLEADGACGVYTARPLSCRSLLSTRPADWCAVDFADLHPLEKQAFMSSLDPALVDWPTHYLAAPRGFGQELESTAAWRILERFGFTLTGNLPFLVWLEKEFGLSEAAVQGDAAVLTLLEKERLNLPFLIHLGIPQCPSSYPPDSAQR